MINNNYKLIGSNEIEEITGGNVRLTEKEIYRLGTNYSNYSILQVNLNGKYYLLVDCEDFKDIDKYITSLYTDTLVEVLESAKIDMYYSSTESNLYIYFTDERGDESFITINRDNLKYLDSEALKILNNLIIERSFKDSKLIDFKSFTQFMKTEIINNPQKEDSVKYFNTFKDLKEYVIERLEGMNTFNEILQAYLGMYDLALKIKTYFIEDAGLYIYTEI